MISSDFESGIISINTSDTGGGAEQFARLMHETNQRCGVESRLLVGDKQSDDAATIPLWESPYFDYSPFQEPLKIRERKLCRQIYEKMGVEDFLYPYSHFPAQLSGLNPALIHLHNLHGGYFDLGALPALSRTFPTVWTLHDYWALTGHCAYPLQCERWKTGCGDCPDLQRAPAIARDATRMNFARKKSIFENTKLHIAAASQSLLDRIPGSMLEPAVIDTRRIPYGIDLEVFEPGNSLEARRRLNLPKNPPLLLFAAYDAATNPYKDFETIVQAIEVIFGMQPEHPLELVVLGSESLRKRDFSFPVHFVPFTHSRSEMAEYFRAADLYLHAANDEVFGIVMLEAMACGTPIVATDVGGIPEVFEHESEGLLVPPKDPESMARATLRLLDSPKLLNEFSANALAGVRQRNDIKDTHRTYLSWFQEIIESRHNSASIEGSFDRAQT